MEIFLFIVLTCFLIAVVLATIYTIQGAPFVVSRDQDIEIMLRLLKVKSGERAVDIGSGDGKLVILLAQKGLIADGYEINPWLVYKSRKEIKRLKLQKRAHIYWKSFWKTDFSSYSVVTIYAIKHIMGRLEKKLQRELPKDARIASNYFTFPHWKPVKEEGRVHLYRKGIKY